LAAGLPDPRHRRGIRHAVDPVLVLALAAVVAGQRNYVAISDWIHDLDPDQRAAFGCPRWGSTDKVPSEPTLRRVLQQIDADEADRVLNAWLADEERRLSDAMAIDGKSVRGSGHGDRQHPVYLLAGFVHRTGQVMGQVEVDPKTNESPQLKDLLDPHDITGQIVTVNALHTPRDSARYLVEDKHAHYVMEVKGNQPTLQDALAAVGPEDFSPSGEDDGQGPRPDRNPRRADHDGVE
jgi:hypothetical protein